jgi:hypothetical protein
MFNDLHEAFFCDFLHLLHERLLRLKENHSTNHIRQLEWHLVEIVQLQKFDNKFTHVVGF